MQHMFLILRSVPLHPLCATPVETSQIMKYVKHCFSLHHSWIQALVNVCMAIKFTIIWKNTKANEAEFDSSDSDDTGLGEVTTDETDIKGENESNEDFL